MEVGKTFLVEKVVSKSETASYYGSGLLDVLATPAMIALMEKAAHLLAKLALPSNQDTVGIEVNVKHLKATPLGAKIRAQAELIKIEGKKLTFRVTAYDNEGEIGSGLHLRYIINPVKFMERIS